jgi:hypothetical protein
MNGLEQGNSKHGVDGIGRVRDGGGDVGDAACEEYGGVRGQLPGIAGSTFSIPDSVSTGYIGVSMGFWASCYKFGLAPGAECGTSQGYSHWSAISRAQAAPILENNHVGPPVQQLASPEFLRQTASVALQ